MAAAAIPPSESEEHIIQDNEPAEQPVMPKPLVTPGFRPQVAQMSPFAMGIGPPGTIGSSITGLAGLGATEVSGLQPAITGRHPNDPFFNNSNIGRKPLGNGTF